MIFKRNHLQRRVHQHIIYTSHPTHSHLPHIVKYFSKTVPVYVMIYSLDLNMCLIQNQHQSWRLQNYQSVGNLNPFRLPCSWTAFERQYFHSLCDLTYTLSHCVYSLRAILGQFLRGNIFNNTEKSFAWPHLLRLWRLWRQQGWSKLLLVEFT